MQIGLMSGKGTIDVVLILWLIHVEQLSMEKTLYMCFYIWKIASDGIFMIDVELAIKKAFQKHWLE